jgi:hypothetical protein
MAKLQIKVEVVLIGIKGNVHYGFVLSKHCTELRNATARFFLRKEQML